MEDNSTGIIAGLFGSLLYLAIFVGIIAGLWKLFEKAGKPGWAALVPIYNIIIMHEIIGRDVWKIVLLMIPLVNIYFGITLYVSFAKSYGKTGIGDFLLVIFVGFVALPIWGFDQNVRYVGPSESPTGAPTIPSF